MMTANSTTSSLSGRTFLLVSYAPGRQDVVEHCLDLRLAPSAAGLDVAEQPLDVADLRGHRLDVAHGLLHRGELVDDAVEAFAHLLLDGGVKLLVYGLVDVGELRLVALTQFAQLEVQQLANGLELCAGLLDGLGLTLGQRQAQFTLIA